MENFETIVIKLPIEMYNELTEIFARYGLTLEETLVLFFKETVRLGRIPFDYTEADLEEAQRLEMIMNDDLCDE